MAVTPKYVALIPVRGGSVSIPNKNIKQIGGKPLVQWVIDAAVACDLIDAVYVSSDSEDILCAVASGCADKVCCIRRDDSLATSTATTESVMIDFAHNFEFENIVLIQATSPLLTSGELCAGIEKHHSGDYDSVISAVIQKRFNWVRQQDGVATPLNYDPSSRPMRQDFDGYYVENGAFYITSRTSLIETGVRISGRIGIQEMDEASYYEIDEPSDWEIVESLLIRRDKKINSTHKVKLFATDVDGVLTDGGMYYSEEGDELKKFDTRDGMGFELLRDAGIRTAIITGENTSIVARRAKKIKADYLRQGVKDKLPVLKAIVDELGIGLDEVAYIGDDINDIECMRTAGLGITVPGGCLAAKKVATYITESEGGRGAAREAAEYVISFNKGQETV